MTVEGTTERVLRLLELLQRRPAWTASDLAAELDVTDRSVRRDVDRLRNLGYPVLATAGVGGGYQLGAGTRLPPLLLDDEEAIATAVSLRVAAGGTIAGADDAALRALAKLDQVMPPRLKERVSAVHGATDSIATPGAPIAAELLLTLARACRDLVRVTFTYKDVTRTVEPVRLVTTGRRWYLMAFDVDRDDWRTFRLDRMADVAAGTWRFREREHPDPVGFVQRAVAESPYRFTARIRVHAPADDVRDLVPATVGRVQEEGPTAACWSSGPTTPTGSSPTPHASVCPPRSSSPRNCATPLSAWRPTSPASLRPPHRRNLNAWRGSTAAAGRVVQHRRHDRDSKLAAPRSSRG